MCLPFFFQNLINFPMRLVWIRDMFKDITGNNNIDDVIFQAQIHQILVINTINNL